MHLRVSVFIMLKLDTMRQKKKKMPAVFGHINSFPVGL